MKQPNFNALGYAAEYAMSMKPVMVLGLGPWSLVVLKDNLAVLGPVLGLEV